MIVAYIKENANFFEKIRFLLCKYKKAPLKVDYSTMLK